MFIILRYDNTLKIKNEPYLKGNIKDLRNILTDDKINFKKILLNFTDDLTIIYNKSSNNLTISIFDPYNTVSYSITKLEIRLKEFLKRISENNNILIYNKKQYKFKNFNMFFY